MRESFVFYSSFYDSISYLPEDSQFRIYKAIFCYEFEWIEPQLEWIEDAIRKLIKPQLDANNKRYLDWCKGGRPPKKTTGLWKWKTTGSWKKKPNDNENDNVNENENEISSNEEPPTAEYGNKFVNEFICTVQQIYMDCAMEREVDRKEVVHWINCKTGEPTKNRKQYMNEHGYSTVYDMIRDLLERLKTMKYGHWWASRIDTLWNKKTDIMNWTRDYMKIGEKSHFDWYLNNVVGKVKFQDYDGEKFYTPAMYSKYLQLECGMDMLEAQELRDKFLSD